MKHFILILSFILFGSTSIGAFAAEKKGFFDSLDTYVGVGVSQVNYSFNNCNPVCPAGSIPGTTALSAKIGAFYVNKSWLIEPGIEAEWMQTTEIHSEKIGAVDGRVGSVSLLGRMKFGKWQPYAGAGLGLQTDKVNTNYGEGSCSHSAKILIGGVKYFFSPKTAAFVEFRNIKSQHANFITLRPDISVDTNMNVGTIGIIRRF